MPGPAKKAATNQNVLNMTVMLLSGNTPDDEYQSNDSFLRHRPRLEPQLLTGPGFALVGRHLRRH
jgi:hypothetical protein